MKLYNVPLKERQATLIHAYKEYINAPTLNFAMGVLVSGLEKITEVKSIADNREKELNK